MATKALSRILVRLAAVWVVLFLVFREMVMYATVTSVPEPPPTRMSDYDLISNRTMEDEALIEAFSAQSAAGSSGEPSADVKSSEARRPATQTPEPPPPPVSSLPLLPPVEDLSPARKQFLAEMDRIQRTCREPRAHTLTDHGFGVDLLAAAHGAVLKAFQAKQAFRIRTSPEGWHYSRGVCDAKDLSCYFLTTELECDPSASTEPNAAPGLEPSQADAIWYLTRARPGIKARVAARIATVGLPPGKCAAVHVRRSDTVLNRGWGNLGNEKARPLFKYVTMDKYIEQASPVLQRNGVQELLLLSDDSAALDEIKEDKAPLRPWQGKWHYIKRKRFKGSEGGWENHFPSKDRSDEMVTLLSLRELVKNCVVWVGSRSSFANFLQLGMKQKPEVVTVNTKNDAA